MIWEYPSQGQAPHRQKISAHQGHSPYERKCLPNTSSSVQCYSNLNKYFPPGSFGDYKMLHYLVFQATSTDRGLIHFIPSGDKSDKFPPLIPRLFRGKPEKKISTVTFPKTEALLCWPTLRKRLSSQPLCVCRLLRVDEAFPCRSTTGRREAELRNFQGSPETFTQECTQEDRIAFSDSRRIRGYPYPVSKNY